MAVIPAELAELERVKESLERKEALIGGLMGELGRKDALIAREAGIVAELERTVQEKDKMIAGLQSEVGVLQGIAYRQTVIIDDLRGDLDSRGKCGTVVKDAVTRSLELVDELRADLVKARNAADP